MLRIVQLQNDMENMMNPLLETIPQPCRPHRVDKQLGLKPFISPIYGTFLQPTYVGVK